ncbi:MAG: helix-turn-helix transcriptional regulator [bacterium]|nr:helix-turn-helix transcriptional regulator [bacterium]
MPVLLPSLADSLHIRLFATGNHSLGAWWTATDHIRSMWRLCRADVEGAWLEFDSKSYAFPAGRFAMVPPGLKFEAHLNGRVRLFYIHFEVIGWPTSAVRSVLPEPVTLQDDEFRDTLGQALSIEVGQADHLGLALSCRVKSLAHLALATLEHDLPEEKVEMIRHVADGQLDLVEVLQFIDRNIREPLDNARLAEIADCSESSFIRRFREAMGETPARYVQDRRVSAAAELLVCTNYSIDEVAQRCGFANRYYFSRVFSERVGRPPARYRNDRPIDRASGTKRD